MKGYIYNTITVMAGSFIGYYFGKKIGEKVKDEVFNVLGLITIFLGIKMTLLGQDLIIIVLSLVLGTFIGSLINLEDRVFLALDKIRKSFNKEGKIEGFLVASTLFCVGSMTIIGSIKDGLYNDGTIIKIKSVMDGFASIILTAKYGLSVIFSAFTVFFIQGMLTMFSSYLKGLPTSFMANLDGVGGIIVLSIGFNLLNIKKIKTFNMLPAILILPIISLWLS